MDRDYYGVFYCGGGRDVPPQLVSRHWTYDGAMKAYRRRNRHLFDKKWAERHGMLNAFTFDRVFRVEGGIIDNTFDFGSGY